MLFTGGWRLLLFPKVSSIKTNGPTDRIIVINPLRCVKLVLSALSCVSDRVSNGRSISLSLYFPQKWTHNRPLDNYSFPRRWDDEPTHRFTRRGRFARQLCSSERGSGRFTFATSRSRVRRSYSRFLRPRWH